jgi:hypothetical protein
MTLTNYLKGQLSDFVDSYKNFFQRTFGATLTFTVVCFVGVALLVRFSEFDKLHSPKQISILSYFFHRYSKADTYSIVDLAKTLFLFFVAVFSIGLSQQTDNDIEKKEFSFSKLLEKIKLKDIIFLLGILVITSAIDFSLAKFNSYSTSHYGNIALDKYLHDVLFNLRIYIPLILFALTIRTLTVKQKIKMTFKRIFFLYISLWLFNEFAYEVSIWVKNHLFALILLPVDNPDRIYLYESFLSIPLIAFYFLGYSSAMTTSLRLMEK